MRQYREAKEQHPEGILLFRLGDFYEVFFEDALIAAPVMGVTLTSRPLGKAGRAPMCGVPYHAWQSYVGKLLRAGHKVVICDQLEAAGQGPVVKRDVTRVLTPGTVVEDSYLDPTRPNYLVAAWARGADAGLAACDVSTGELLLCQLAAERLNAELERLAPAELLTPPAIEEYRFDPVRGQQRLRDLLGIAYPAAIGAADAPLAIGAAGVVLDYLKQIQTRLGPGQLTVRTYKADVRERVLAAIERIAKGCATAAGLPSDKMPTVNVLRDQFTPATYNNPGLTKRLVAVWKKALGDQNVEMVDPTMGGEDFSEYSLLPEHSIPAVDFHVGAVDPAKIAESKKPGASPLPSLHSSKFAPVPEPTIRTGMVAMTAAVLDLMKK